MRRGSGGDAPEAPSVRNELRGSGRLDVPGDGSFDDPMARVFGLDSTSLGATRWVGYGLGAVAVMLGLGMSARALAGVLNANSRDPIASPPQELEIQSDLAPPPPPPPSEPVEKPAPEPPPRPVARDTPPPAPAQASKVLAQEPDPNTPVDLTGDTIVMGNGDTYVGGVTSSNGTSRTAVRGLTSPTGPPAPPGPPPIGPDRSRPPSLVGGSEWSCPFPPEADVAQIDDAYATVRVDVGADGAPATATVLSDPGNGFGREARRCALDRRYNPGLDHDGHAIAGRKTVLIHFSR
jgi:periplasmic protein TonB